MIHNQKTYYLNFFLQNYPEHTKALLLMGDINVNVLKKLDDAEKNFARVVELEPENVQAHHNLCVVHVERGDLIRAEKCLTKVGDSPQRPSFDLKCQSYFNSSKTTDPFLTI